MNTAAYKIDVAKRVSRSSQRIRKEAVSDRFCRVSLILWHRIHIIKVRVFKSLRNVRSRDRKEEKLICRQEKQFQFRQF